MWTVYLFLNIALGSCFPPLVDGPPESHHSWFRVAQRAWGPDEYRNCITITVSVCAWSHTLTFVCRSYILEYCFASPLFFEFMLAHITLSTILTFLILTVFTIWNVSPDVGWLILCLPRFTSQRGGFFCSPFSYSRLGELCLDWLAYHRPIWGNPPWHWMGISKTAATEEIGSHLKFFLRS